MGTQFNNYFKCMGAYYAMRSGFFYVNSRPNRKPAGDFEKWFCLVDHIENRCKLIFSERSLSIIKAINIQIVFNVIWIFRKKTRKTINYILTIAAFEKDIMIFKINQPYWSKCQNFHISLLILWKNSHFL